MNQSSTEPGEHLATKADLTALLADVHKELRTQFYWLVVIQISLLGIAITPIYLILSYLANRLHP